MPAMNDIHNIFALSKKRFVKLLVKGTVAGIDQIVVYPHTMDQIQWVRVVDVVLIKRLIKGRMRDGIGPDGIRPKLLDLLEPTQIFLLSNGIIRGKMSRLAKAKIHTPEIKDLQSVAGIQI